jgi:hypothetical protein
MHRFVRALHLAPILAALAIASPTGQAPAPATHTKASPAAKAWTPSLTPDGRPDLEGIWVNKIATPLERPKELEGVSRLTDAQVDDLRRRARRLFGDGKADFAPGDQTFLAALRDVSAYKNPNATGDANEMIELVFENRTSLIVDPPDGKIPALTPAAAQRRAALEEGARRIPAGPEDLSDILRCISFGVPRLGGALGAGPYGYYQIVQSPKHVVLLMESIHDARIIPLDGRPHLPGDVYQRHGDSRGRWEGHTLVVDTTNFSPESRRTGSFHVLNNFMESFEHLHLIERFTRVAPDTINYELTFNDPTTWTKPWTAMIPLKRSHETVYEFACHEGNESTMNGILRGARAQDARTLDFEFFRSKVEPIFLAKRPGHARCIACHGSGTPLRLQPLGAGRTAWTEEESRKNFETIRRVAIPGDPTSRLLVHVLAEEAGGDFYHNGGKHWSSQNDPEWQTLKAFVLGQTAAGGR